MCYSSVGRSGARVASRIARFPAIPARRLASTKARRRCRRARSSPRRAGQAGRGSRLRDRFERVHCVADTNALPARLTWAQPPVRLIPASPPLVPSHRAVEPSPTRVSRPRLSESRSMLSRRQNTLLAAAIALSAPGLMAQSPDRPKNLRALPRDLTMDSVFTRMLGVADALGVTCGFCHVGGDPADLGFDGLWRRCEADEGHRASDDDHDGPPQSRDAGRDAESLRHPDLGHLHDVPSRSTASGCARGYARGHHNEPRRGFGSGGIPLDPRPLCGPNDV